MTVSVSSYDLIAGGGEIAHAVVTAGSDSGTAPIIVTDETGASTTGTAIVTVPVPVDPYIYSFGTTVAVGNTTGMAILVINEYDGLPIVGDTLSFSLGNGNIGAAWVNATTDSNGVAYMNVTGINVGDTPITVTDETHYAQGYGSVSVTSAPVTNITVGNANVNVGDTTQVIVSVTIADGTPAVGDGLNVSVGDGTIASAAWLNGNSTTDASGNATLVITGVASGSTQVTVTDSHGGSGYGQVSVGPAVRSIYVSSQVFTVGLSDTLSVTVTDDSGNPVTETLNVTSDSPAISGQLPATVTTGPNGVVLVPILAVDAGNFNVNCADAGGNCGNGPEQAKHQTVTLTLPPGVQEPLNIYPGQIGTLSAA